MNGSVGAEALTSELVRLVSAEFPIDIAPMAPPFDATSAWADSRLASDA